MKRFLKLLLVAILVMPFMAKADMGAPQISSIEVTIANENGIDYYDYDGKTVKGHLNKGDKIKVVSLDIDGNEYYVELANGNDAIVKASDIKNNSEYPVTSKDVVDRGQDYEIYVFEEKGVDIRKGPYDFYEKVAHLDAGTKLKYRYAIYDGEGNGSEDGKYNFGIHAVYVEQDGVKGWINILDSKVLVSVEPKYYIIFNSIDSENTFYSKGSSSDFKVIKSSGWETNSWDREILVYEDGKFKLIDDYYSIIPAKIQSYTSKKDIKGEQNTIKAGTEFYILVGDDYDDSSFIYMVKGSNKICSMYSDDFDEKLMKSFTKVSEAKVEDVFTISEVVEPEYKTTITKENNNDNNNKESKTTNTIVICAIVGCSVALIAVVTIILLNKKKNK